MQPEVKKPEQTVEITPDILIQTLANTYPQTIETLVIEYGFHCVGCFASQFETLEEGARVHGIVGGDFEELLAHLCSLVGQANVNVSEAAA